MIRIIILQKSKSVNRKGKCMKAGERRETLKKILTQSAVPVSGSALAKMLSVSRQVIVTDIAILRAEGFEIISTSQGYMTPEGAVVKDVFVSHRAYGVLRGELDIRSRLDVQAFLESIRSGKSTLLSSTTEGYHYHTLLAPSESVLDTIENRLWEMGFLAKTLDYEPEELKENIQERRPSSEDTGTGAG